MIPIGHHMKVVRKVHMKGMITVMVQITGILMTVATMEVMIIPPIMEITDMIIRITSVGTAPALRPKAAVRTMTPAPPA